MYYYRNLRKNLVAFICFFMPSYLACLFLRLLGQKVSLKAKIGFSWITASKISLCKESKIGHLNYIKCESLVLQTGSCLGRFNVISGPIVVNIGRYSAIGNYNRIVRGPVPTVCVGDSFLRIGSFSKITSGHYIDCTRSIKIKSNSIIAGLGSQLWTHGYVHEKDGKGRYRIDGQIIVGNNVYVGSGCIFTAGVTIADGAIVGSGTTVSKELLEPMLYVSSSLRVLPRPQDPLLRNDLSKEYNNSLLDVVYLKQIKHND